jgi:hypothetical protein
MKARGIALFAALSALALIMAVLGLLARARHSQFLAHRMHQTRERLVREAESVLEEARAALNAGAWPGTTPFSAEGMEASLSGAGMTRILSVTAWASPSDGPSGTVTKAPKAGLEHGRQKGVRLSWTLDGQGNPKVWRRAAWHIQDLLE